MVKKIIQKKQFLSQKCNLSKQILIWLKKAGKLRTASSVATVIIVMNVLATNLNREGGFFDKFQNLL
jgi:hypothetical protein